MKLKDRIEQLRETAQTPRVSQGEGWYSRYFIRRYSMYVSYFLWKTGVSANTTTIAMGVVGLLGSICVFFDGILMPLLAALLWQLWFLLDCADGEIARLSEKSSRLGKYLDELTHIFVNPTFTLAFGIKVYIQEKTLFMAMNVIAVLFLFFARRELLRSSLTQGIHNHLAVKNREMPLFENCSLIFWFRFLFVQSAGEIGQIFIIPLVLIIDNIFVFNVSKWFLVFYNITAGMYVLALVVRNGRLISKTADIK